MNKQLYKQYSSSIDFSEFDHLIVGSGIGGLTVAVWLAKAGKKVAVFERHFKPGGFTHCFERKGRFKWDVGVHYVGNLGKQGSVRGLFDFITNSKVEWEDMGEVYDVIKIANDTYELKAGKENFRKQLVAYFPDEEKAIYNYLNLIQKVNKLGGAFFLEKTFKPILSKTLGALLRKRYAKYSQKTTYDTLSELTSNKRLIAVLCGQFGNYGLTPKFSSFAAHAMIVGHFMQGGYYPKGGVDSISNATIETLNYYGGEVFVNANVTEIVSNKNRVKGIKVGEDFIACKSVISNVGINNTFNSLVSVKAKQKCKINLENVEPSIGHMCLYVGLNKSDKYLALPKHNLWCYDSDDYDAIFEESNLMDVAKKSAYISFPSAKDSQWNQEYPDKATIQVISMGRYSWFKKYEKLPVMKRGEEYMKLKKQFEKIMLDRLFKLFPQIKGHIAITEVSSPLSTKHFSNCQHGEIYGLEHTPERFALPFLRSETKIKGLRLVGQDIMLVGLAGAMLSGMLCATTILKFRVWKMFKEIAQIKSKLNN